MEEPMIVFEPVTAGMDSLSITAIIILVGCIAGSWVLLRQKASGRNRNTNMLVVMLLFFTGMIALGTLVFNNLAQQRVGVVQIYADRLELGRRSIPFTDIDNAVIEEAGRSSSFNPGVLRDRNLLLLISERGGKTYVLSSEHYPVQEVMGTLRSAMRGQPLEAENE
ncbi:MAG TPA: hypothetical protein PKC76_07390 [Saprospiraceae bacterium]|nr:hypothetical protein [Saprospiraceae bacterium]HMP23936.1 hypothetical protein [Saprospiraceae bacterium]